MWLLLLEAALALSLLVFIVVWTVWPKRKELGQEMRRPSADADDVDVAEAPDPVPESRVSASTVKAEPTRDQ